MRRILRSALFALSLLVLLACTLPLRVSVRTAPEPTASPIPTAKPTPEPTPAPTAEPTEEPTPAPTDAPAPSEQPGPVLTLIGDADMTVDAAFFFIDPGALACDAAGRDITDRVTVEGEVIAYLVDTYTLVYTVADDAGRTASATRTVRVKPVDMPEIVTPPEKTVYLTFDDGPAGNTKYLLDTLKKYDAKATFFVIGEKKLKEYITRAYEEGHAIGVHTYTHDYDKCYASDQAFFEDFLATEAVIFAATGEHTRIFRFPGGSGNTASIKRCPGLITRMAKIMEDMGYRYFDWNVSGGDTAPTPRTLEEIRDSVISGLKRNKDYAIVLQHDISLNSVRAVEHILRWGKENGYTFRALDLTSPVVHSKIQN